MLHWLGPLSEYVHIILLVYTIIEGNSIYLLLLLGLVLL